MIILDARQVLERRIEFRILRQEIPEGFAHEFFDEDEEEGWWRWVAPNGVIISSRCCPEISTTPEGDLLLYVRGTDSETDNTVLRCDRRRYNKIRQAINQLNSFLSAYHRGPTLEEEFFNRAES